MNSDEASLFILSGLPDVTLSRLGLPTSSSTGSGFPEAVRRAISPTRTTLDIGTHENVPQQLRKTVSTPVLPLSRQKSTSQKSAYTSAESLREALKPPFEIDTPKPAVAKPPVGESAVPPTLIPKAYHIVTTSHLPPIQTDCYFSELDTKTRTWHTTIFPSLKPSTRKEVVLLDKCLGEMLSQAVVPDDDDSEETDPMNDLMDRRSILSVVFHELVRQVTTYCVERGHVMMKVWGEFCDLLDRTVQINRKQQEEHVAMVARLNTFFQTRIQHVEDDSARKDKTYADVLSRKGALDRENGRLLSEMKHQSDKCSQLEERIAVLERENRSVRSSCLAANRMLEELRSVLRSEPTKIYADRNNDEDSMSSCFSTEDDGTPAMALNYDDLKGLIRQKPSNPSSTRNSFREKKSNKSTPRGDSSSLQTDAALDGEALANDQSQEESLEQNGEQDTADKAKSAADPYARIAELTAELEEARLLLFEVEKQRDMEKDTLKLLSEVVSAGAESMKDGQGAMLEAALKAMNEAIEKAGTYSSQCDDLRRRLSMYEVPGARETLTDALTQRVVVLEEEIDLLSRGKESAEKEVARLLESLKRAEEEEEMMKQRQEMRASSISSLDEDVSRRDSVMSVDVKPQREFLSRLRHFLKWHQSPKEEEIINGYSVGNAEGVDVLQKRSQVGAQLLRELSDSGWNPRDLRYALLPEEEDHHPHQQHQQQHHQHRLSDDDYNSGDEVDDFNNISGLELGRPRPLNAMANTEHDHYTPDDRPDRVNVPTIPTRRMSEIGTKLLAVPDLPLRPSSSPNLRRRFRTLGTQTDDSNSNKTLAKKGPSGRRGTGRQPDGGLNSRKRTPQTFGSGSRFAQHFGQPSGNHRKPPLYENHRNPGYSRKSSLTDNRPVWTEDDGKLDQGSRASTPHETGETPVGEDFIHAVEKDSVGTVFQRLIEDCKDRTPNRPKAQVLKLIAKLYGDKAGMNESDDRDRTRRHTLKEFVYETFLNKYGLKNMADKHVTKLVANVHAYAPESKRISMFGKFLGIFEGYTVDAFDFVLYLINIRVNGVRWINSMPEEEPFNVSVQLSTDALRVVIEPTHPEVFAAIVDELGPLLSPPSSPAEQQHVSLDDLLDIVLSHWRSVMETVTQRLTSLFRAADINDTHSLTYSELHAAIRYIDPNTPPRKINRMYREAYSAGQGGLLRPGVTLDAFVEFCRVFGLVSWGTDFVNPKGTDATSAKVATVEALAKKWEGMESILERQVQEIKRQQATNAMMQNGSPQLGGPNVKQFLDQRVKHLKMLISLGTEPIAAWQAYAILLSEIVSSATSPRQIEPKLDKSQQPDMP